MSTRERERLVAIEADDLSFGAERFFAFLASLSAFGFHVEL